MIYKTLRRAVIFVIGITVVLFGIVLIVLPGPAVVVIPAGLAILATEFVWARQVLKSVRHQASRLVSKKPQAEPTSTTP